MAGKFATEEAGLASGVSSAAGLYAGVGIWVVAW